jgi:uncharacterized membrane protein
MSEHEPASTEAVPTKESAIRRFIRETEVGPFALCATVGALGILNGFALFFLFQHEIKAGHLYTSFPVGIGIAAVLAYLIETLRHWVKHPQSPHPPLSELASTFVVIVLAELLIAAAHAFVSNAAEFFSAPCEDANHSSADHVTRKWAAELLAAEPNAVFTLIFLAVAWIAIGALLAVRLQHIVLRAPPDVKDSVRFGASVGAKAGFVFAPLGMLAAVLLLRLIIMLRTAETDPIQWARFIDSWQYLGHKMVFFERFLSATLPILALEGLRIVAHNIGLIATATVYGLLLVAGLVMRRQSGRTWLFNLAVGIGLFYLSVAAIQYELLGPEVELQILWVPAMAALIWGVPGVLLGALVPLWRRFNEDRRWWTAVALAVALLLMVVTAFRLLQPGEPSGISWLGPLILSVLALLAGYVFRKGDPLADQWPFAALMVALVIGLVTSLSATFVGVWAQVNAINTTVSLGASIGDPICLREYRTELLKAQFSPIGERETRVNGLKDKLQRNVEDAAERPFVCQPDIDITSCNVEVLLAESLFRFCSNEERAMLKAFDSYENVAKLETQCAAVGAPKWLEIALAASFAFWVALGLLAAYRRYETSAPE